VSVIRAGQCHEVACIATICSARSSLPMLLLLLSLPLPLLLPGSSLPTPALLYEERCSAAGRNALLVPLKRVHLDQEPEREQQQQQQQPAAQQLPRGGPSGTLSRHTAKVPLPDWPAG